MIYDLITIPDDRRIDTERTIPFSPEQVFHAFSDSSLLASWWGPTGFSNTFHEFDFKEDGKWIFTMHAPNGADYKNESRFLRIVEPSLVILDHECAPLFQAHFALNEAPEGTEIKWTMVFQDAKTCTAVLNLAKGANEQNLDRLVAALKG